MTKSLGTEFLREIARVIVVLGHYKGIPAGAWAASHIQATLKRATEAWDSQDTVAMIQVYPELQDIK